MKDNEAFIGLFTRWQPVLRRYVAAHVPDYHQAEDIMQEIAVVLFRKFNSYDPDREFVRWAIGIARNEILNSRRKFARSRLILTDDLEKKFTERLLLRIGSTDQRGQYLPVCLEKLAKAERSIIHQRYEQQRCTEEIAGAVNKSANAVRIILTRIREKLAECINRSFSRDSNKGRVI